MGRITKIADLLAAIGKHLEAGTYRYTKHALQRMETRKVIRPEVVFVLREGRHEKRKDTFNEAFKSWDYAIHGKTVDGRKLRIVVAFDDLNMLIITAIDLKKDEDDGTKK